MIRPRTAVVIGLLVVLIALAGCSGGETTPTPTPESTPAPTQTPTATPTAAPAPTATPAATGTPPTPVTTPTAATPGGSRDLSFAVAGLAECGVTCRDVEYRVANGGDGTIRDLDAEITLRSGGESVWSGDRTIGDLGAGQTVTVAQRIDVGTDGGLTIQENGGNVTLVVDLQSADGSQRIVREEQF
jgi:hypothetical protein